MINKNKLVELLATFFYIGKIKYCPGTFGSLAAFPLYYIIVYFTMTNQIIFSFKNLNNMEQQMLTIFTIVSAFNIALFIIGIYCSSLYIKNTGREDPKEVVIDEVVGQMLVVSSCVFSNLFIHYSNVTNYLDTKHINFIFLFILPFVLFRFFDIIKPWPINWADRKIKGGLGVMLDDILAAIFAIVCQYAITFIIIDWVGAKLTINI